MKTQIIVTLSALAAQQANTLEVSTTDATENQTFDLPIKKLSPEGSNPSRSGFFEAAMSKLEERRSSSINADKESGHPMLSAPDTFDLDMPMLMDWNHVIELTMTKANSTLNVIPDTRHHKFMLAHPNCDDCFVEHGTKWAPDSKKPLREKVYTETYDFLYMMHSHESTVTARYWMTAMCFNIEEEACATEYPVFSIQTASPYFYALGDGYLGLEPRALAALTRENMITKPIMGVHTHMFDSDEDPSHIRFGGYNEELFAQGESQVWLPSVNNTSWEMEMSKVKFHGESIGESANAIINPGYPFIGMPKSSFDLFKQDVIAAYPDEALTCEALDWCYFINTCAKIEEQMPDLELTIKDSEGADQTIKVPPKAFLYTLKDTKTGLDQCHLGIIGQVYSNSDVWQLGQSFMENYYVAFDAHVPHQPKIGLSYKPVTFENANGAAETDGQEGASASGNSSGVIITIVIAAVLSLVVAGAVLGCRFFYKRSQEKKLEKAKTYFDSLQTKDESGEAKSNTNDDADIETSDPNTFC